MAQREAASALEDQVKRACRDGRSLRIRGGGTRAALCEPAVDGTPELDVSGHRGIIEFEAAELMLTARAGTPLEEIEAVLAEAGQQLPFDPPRFGAASTLGGAVASGLAGPGRPWQGAVRDAVLGVTLLDGRGEIGRYGGRVMKNVAGYDVARLNAGAFGALGVLLDVSIRLLPQPACRETRVLELGLEAALERMLALAATPLPLAGLAWQEGRLRIALAGSEAGVVAACERVGGEPLPDARRFWQGLRDQELAFFQDDGALWRLSLPAGAAQPDLAANWLLDWGGSQRWCLTDAQPQRVFEAAAARGGHAMRLQPDCLRPPLAPGLRVLHERIRAVFDPAGTFAATVTCPESS